MTKTLFSVMFVAIGLTGCMDHAVQKSSSNQLDSLFTMSYQQITNKKYNEAIKALDQGITQALKLADTTRLAIFCYNKATVKYSIEEIDSSIYFFQYVIPLFNVAHDNDKIVQCNQFLGILHQTKGLHKKAIFNYLSALEMAESLNAFEKQAELRNSMGSLHQEIKEYGKAIFYFEKALDFYQSSDNIFYQAIIMNNLGNTYYGLGNYPRAKKFYREAQFLNISLGDSLSISRTSLNMGELSLENNELDSAKFYLESALKIRESLYPTPDFVGILNLLGEVHRKSKEYDASRQYLLMASDTLVRTVSRKHSLDNYKYQKNLFSDLGNYKQASFGMPNTIL